MRAVMMTAAAKGVKDFVADAGPSVCLAQLRAGGVGLNLQKTQVLILMDPWWTPAAEKQVSTHAEYCDGSGVARHMFSSRVGHELLSSRGSTSARMV